MLTSKEKRRYAQAIRRLEIGAWGYKKSLFRTINLTTREGDDNSVGRFVKDFRKLIGWFRAFGYKVEYCCAIGYTPGKGLIHLHGLLRIKGGVFAITRRQLGDKWNEIHGAFVVKMAGVKSYKTLFEYSTKHILKDYMRSEGEEDSRFMTSGGWRRKGYEVVVAEVKRWWLEGTGHVWLTSEGWKMINKVIRRWCEKKAVALKTNWGYLVMDGRVVAEAVIYDYGKGV